MKFRATGTYSIMNVHVSSGHIYPIKTTLTYKILVNVSVTSTFILEFSILAILFLQRLYIVTLPVNFSY